MIKQIFCCILIAIVSVFTFTGCGQKLEDITEEEIMAFYEKYVEEDNFKYLLIKTQEEIRSDGVPQYVLDRWGLEYTSLMDFAAIADYVSPEDMAQLEKMNTGEWTYFNIFRLADIQALMDGMWGTGTIDVNQWYQDDKTHYISFNGYMVAFVVATGWYDTWWIEFEGIELNGTRATVLIKSLECREDGEYQLRDCSKKEYVYTRGDYRLAYPIIAENFDLDNYRDGTIDEVLGSVGLTKEDIGSIKLEFEMTKEGIRLVGCGPEIDVTVPEEIAEDIE